MTKFNIAFEACVSRHFDNLGDNDRQFIQRIYSDGLDKYLDRIKAINFINQRQILDAGCGFGQWSLALASVNENVTSCDISSCRISYLSDLAVELGIKNIKTHVSGLDTMPFADCSFDAVFCYGVIFLTPWRQTLKELHRVLQPGGSLYLNANGLGWYTYLWMEEHNKAADYDPKKKAAKAMQDTLRYEREGQFLPGSDLIIEPGDIRDEMTRLGFRNIMIGGEGTLHSNKSADPPRPFFKDNYYGLSGIFEVIGTVSEMPHDKCDEDKK